MEKNDLILLNEIKDSINDVKKKLDYILHPEKGIFAELQRINAKADAAHRRIDELVDLKDRKRHNRDRLLVGIIGTAVGVILTVVINMLVNRVF